ncbi:MAG: M20 family metallopeptidase [Bacillota bacterium]
MNKEKIWSAIDVVADRLYQISDWMYHHPEIGHQEREAAKLLAGELERHGFTVTTPFATMETAFKAVYRGGDGPTIAIVAEYDALPGLGHGCGHNIIGTSAIGAAIGLKEGWPEFPGTLVVFGAPAEEGAVDNAGGKVILVENGAFAGVDAAMMIHPSNRSALGGTSNAREAMEITFKGRPAHAAGAPHEGINALDAAIQTFNGFNALRQHVKSDVRIHGIIAEGGVAPNIVPERAVIRMYVRAAQASYLSEVVEKVKNCARAGAMAAGATVEFRQTANTYKNMINNCTLSCVFKRNLEALGEEVLPAGAGAGSTDMANVSHVVPSIHPYIGISSQKIVGHSQGMADATISEEGHRGLLLGAKSLAATAAELFADADLLARVKKEFSEAAK